MYCNLLYQDIHILKQISSYTKEHQLLTDDLVEIKTTDAKYHLKICVNDQALCRVRSVVFLYSIKFSKLFNIPNESPDSTTL